MGALQNHETIASSGKPTGRGNARTVWYKLAQREVQPHRKRTYQYTENSWSKRGPNDNPDDPPLSYSDGGSSAAPDDGLAVGADDADDAKSTTKQPA